jgi:hypothetical protein
VEAGNGTTDGCRDDDIDKIGRSTLAFETGIEDDDGTTGTAPGRSFVTLSDTLS